MSNTASSEELRELLDVYMTPDELEILVKVIARWNAKKVEEARETYRKDLVKKAVRYTADGLAADGLDPWAVPVAHLSQVSKQEEPQ